MGGWEIDLKTNCLTWTDEVYRIHEIDFPYEPCLDKGINFYAPGSKEVIEKAVQRAIENNEAFDVELQIITAKDKLRWVKAIGKSELENNRVFGFFQDIHQHKTNEQLIIQKNEELKRTNELKDKLFSIIAHDLKSPFNSINGFSEVLIDLVESHQYDEIQRVASIILQSSQRAIDLLTNLLEWAQIQTGRMVCKPRYFDLYDLVQEVLRLLEELYQRKSIVVKNLLPQSILVFADIEMMASVFRNLITNAIKFTEINGLVQIQAELSDERAIVRVIDTGTGIEQNRINTLFDLCGNSSTPGTLHEKGTGLGLILCRELIEKQGGTIGAESTLGSGSTFFFSIPTKQTKQNQ